MSRPSSSVPHQWAADGGERRVGRSMWAGSWGADPRGEQSKDDEDVTSTAPVVASGLWRAARGSEMEVEDMVNIIEP